MHNALYLKCSYPYQDKKKKLKTRKQKETRPYYTRKYCPGLNMQTSVLVFQFTMYCVWRIYVYSLYQTFINHLLFSIKYMRTFRV